MSDFSELIVRFKRGIPEDEARRIAEYAGAAVRKKMPTGRPDEVKLLLRVGDVAKIDAELKARKEVIGTELNKAQKTG